MQYEIYSKTIQPENKTEWRWHLVKLSTRKVLSMSAEAFDSKEECEKSIHLNMMADFKTSILVIEDVVKKGFIKDLMNRLKPDDPKVPA